MDEYFLDWSIDWDLLLSWDFFARRTYDGSQDSEYEPKPSISFMIAGFGAQSDDCNIVSQLKISNLTSHQWVGRQHWSPLYHTTEPCLCHHKTITTTVAETEFRFLVCLVTSILVSSSSNRCERKRAMCLGLRSIRNYSSSLRALHKQRQGKVEQIKLQLARAAFSIG